MKSYTHNTKHLIYYGMQHLSSKKALKTPNFIQHITVSGFYENNSTVSHVFLFYDIFDCHSKNAVGNIHIC